MCCIHTSLTLCQEYGDLYTPSERHVCYTLRRGCSYAVAVYITPGNVYAILRHSATFHLSAIAVHRMPHSPHKWSALRLCLYLQSSTHFGYIACRFICFAIIVLYRPEIYCPIFTLSGTLPSVLHSLR